MSNRRLGNEHFHTELLGWNLHYEMPDGTRRLAMVVGPGLVKGELMVCLFLAEPRDAEVLGMALDLRFDPLTTTSVRLSVPDSRLYDTVPDR